MSRYPVVGAFVAPAGLGLAWKCPGTPGDDEVRREHDDSVDQRSCRGDRGRLAIGGLTAAPAHALAGGRRGDIRAGRRTQPHAVSGLEHVLRTGRGLHRDGGLDVADFLRPSGLRDAGYDIVWLDGGGRTRRPAVTTASSAPIRTASRDGMPALTAALHAKGLRAGIYTDAGPYIPGSCGLGSYGHYQTDADTFAAWGFDAVKVDFLCGITAGLDPETVFTEFAAALHDNASGRPLIFNLCNLATSPDWGTPRGGCSPRDWWTYAPAIAESWRTYTDAGFVGLMKYSDVLRNYDANARHPEAAGPGHWNDLT